MSERIVNLNRAAQQQIPDDAKEGATFVLPDPTAYNERGIVPMQLRQLSLNDLDPAPLTNTQRDALLALLGLDMAALQEKLKETIQTEVDQAIAKSIDADFYAYIGRIAGASPEYFQLPPLVGGVDASTAGSSVPFNLLGFDKDKFWINAGAGDRKDYAVLNFSGTNALNDRYKKGIYELEAEIQFSESFVGVRGMGLWLMAFNGTTMVYRELVESGIAVASAGQPIVKVYKDRFIFDNDAFLSRAAAASGVAIASLQTRMGILAYQTSDETLNIVDGYLSIKLVKTDVATAPPASPVSVALDSQILDRAQYPNFALTEQNLNVQETLLFVNGVKAVAGDDYTIAGGILRWVGREINYSAIIELYYPPSGSINRPSIERLDPGQYPSFVLSRPTANTTNQLYINGVKAVLNVDYTINGSNLNWVGSKIDFAPVVMEFYY